MSLFSKLTGDILILDGAHAPQHNQAHVLVQYALSLNLSPQDPCGTTAPTLVF